MVRRVVVALIILGSAVGLYAYYRAPLAVFVVRPTRGPAVEAIYATGSVEPVFWAKVSPLGPDRITAVLVDEGERVGQGTVLARLDDQMERARVAEMEAQVEFLRSEFKRFGQLYEEELATRQSYERVASQLKQGEAALRAAREAVAEKQLVAPIAGIVLRKDGEVGEVVDKGTVVFWIGEPTPLRVTAEVDEEDVARCQPGQKALIKADAFPGQIITGEVAEITPLGDPLNKSYRVRVALPDTTPLHLGMTTELNIIVSEHPNALLVPAKALQDGHVWSVVNNRARQLAVETGVWGDDFVQIQKGLQGDEQLIVNPPAGLKDGLPLETRPQVSRP